MLRVHPRVSAVFGPFLGMYLSDDTSFESSDNRNYAKIAAGELAVVG